MGDIWPAHAGDALERESRSGGCGVSNDEICHIRHRLATEDSIIKYGLSCRAVSRAGPLCIHWLTIVQFTRQGKESGCRTGAGSEIRSCILGGKKWRPRDIQS